MDLKHLQTFLTLCEIKNFTKTAELLHYAQSNVTTQIQQLEEELNTRLFERIGKKVILTPCAVKLKPYAQKMLNLSQDITNSFSNEKNNRITIGASESICIYRLPTIIKNFKQANPNVELFLQVIDTSDYMSLLINNTIDVAFILDTPITHSHINVVFKTYEKISVFSEPNHVLSNKRKVSINDIVEQRLILTKQDCCYRKMFEKDLLNTSKKPLIALETSSLQVIKQSVLSGLGICVLPKISVQKELENKELIEIDYDIDYEIFSQLIVHKDKWLSEPLKAFIDIVKKTK